jgi:hypothetical protein
LLPSVENILHFYAENLLQSDMVQPVSLRHLDGILERATSRSHAQDNDVNKVVNTLRGEEEGRGLSHCPWIVGITVLFLSFGVWGFVWFKRTNRYCPSTWKCTTRPTKPPMITTVQALNKCETGLQVMKKVKEMRLSWYEKPLRRSLRKPSVTDRIRSAWAGGS